jgi:hypothetical protein
VALPISNIFMMHYLIRAVVSQVIAQVGELTHINHSTPYQPSDQYVNYHVIIDSFANIDIRCGSEGPDNLLIFVAFQSECIYIHFRDQTLTKHHSGC